MKGEARRKKASVKSSADPRRKVRRDTAKPLGGMAGASRSESVPVTRRARVDVSAMIETCVAAELEGGAKEGGAYSVVITVPRLLMKASPGPVTRKKPAARNHIVWSPRKRRVSALRSHLFWRSSSSSS